MPWKEYRIVEERLRFIARLLDGEKMAGLCREFGISRKTGYKVYDRYKDCGLDGLTDRSRRPYRQANQLPMQIEKLIVRLKREYPRWGAPKIREKLRRRYPALPCPPISTVHAVLDRQGLVTRRRRRRYKAEGTALSRPATPNELWCADYKGEFMLADRRYCYPLTITDFTSRYLITCDALATTKETYTFTVFERAFKDFGLPRAIRTDNGIPFSCPNALYGLSRLSVWWLHQTRAPGAERSSERMHLTLKDRSHEARLTQLPAPTGALRCLRRAVQPGPAPSGPGHAGASRGIPPVAPTLSGSRRVGLSVPRLDGHRDPVWPHLLPPHEDQPQPGVRGAAGGGHAGKRPHLARQLHALRSRVLRSRDVPDRADRESVSPESVTYVSGIICNLCLRYGPGKVGTPGRIRTCDPRLSHNGTTGSDSQRVGYVASWGTAQRRATCERSRSRRGYSLSVSMCTRTRSRSPWRSRAAQTRQRRPRACRCYGLGTCSVSFWNQSTSSATTSRETGLDPTRSRDTGAGR